MTPTDRKNFLASREGQIGNCECGCGVKTNVYQGKPRRFISGHNSVLQPTRRIHCGSCRECGKDLGERMPCRAIVFCSKACKTRNDWHRRGRKPEEDKRSGAIIRAAKWAKENVERRRAISLASARRLRLNVKPREVPDVEPKPMAFHIHGRRSDRKGNAVKLIGTHTKGQIKALYRIQGGYCANQLCQDLRAKFLVGRGYGITIYPKKKLSDGFHIDHIMPVSRGGSNYIENLQLLCPSCNGKKGAMTMWEFLHWQCGEDLGPVRGL